MGNNKSWGKLAKDVSKGVTKEGKTIVKDTGKSFAKECKDIVEGTITGVLNAFNPFN